MISVRHLSKKYGNHVAVQDLSFDIKKGQIYGFLGPNGAGKSTTMNIMTGCLSATSGEVTIGGYDIFQQPMEAKRLIGYLPEQPPLYTDRTPREYLTFVARAKGIPPAEIAMQVEKAMAVTNITGVADRLIRNLSKGYRQRVGIAQAILGDPEVIILDEPTVGLDPRQIIEIRDLIRSLGEAHTVILSSHILSEVQAVCQTILIIAKGKLVACDTPENLERLFMPTVTVEITAEPREADLAPLEETLSNIPGSQSISLTPQEEGKTLVRLETSPEQENGFLRAAFFAFCDLRIPVLRMVTTKASLEDVFMELTASDHPQASAVEMKEKEAET